MTVVHTRELLYHKGSELLFDVQSVILSYPWLLRVKSGDCLVCLFLRKITLVVISNVLVK